MRKSLVLLIACLLSPGVNADLADLLGGAPAVLRPQQAFAPQLVTGTDGRLTVRFSIAPGHYLYRDRLQLTDAKGAPLHPQLPPGELYEDPEFGPVAVLRGEQALHLDIPAVAGTAIDLRSQGCAQGRLCSAPVSLRLSLPEQSR